VNIISVPQVEVGHWGIWFSMMSEDDVRPHSDASLRKDCKNFRLDLEGVWAALEWLDQWKVRRASYRETVIP
jgi:ribonuclease HI